MSQAGLTCDLLSLSLSCCYVGAAMMFWGTHFSQTIIMAHTIRGQDSTLAISRPACTQLPIYATGGIQSL
jgi:hypothetical protein